MLISWDKQFAARVRQVVNEATVNTQLDPDQLLKKYEPKAAATGGLSMPALTLFGIIFFWQFPHFFAIASIYKDDYKRGGFKMLPVVDTHGLRTAHQTLICAMALIPVSLLPAVTRIAGPTYFTGAFALAMIYLVFSVRASITKATPAWRDLLRTSLIVLPGFFVLMMVDRLPL